MNHYDNPVRALIVGVSVLMVIENGGLTCFGAATETPASACAAQNDRNTFKKRLFISISSRLLAVGSRLNAKSSMSQSLILAYFFPFAAGRANMYPTPRIVLM